MKAKLPFGKKKDADDDEYEEIDDESNSTHQGDATDATDISDLDDEESEEENSSLVYKLKSKLASLSKKKKSKNDDDEEESDEDEDALKKKKKSKIIQIVIGGGLVVFLLSDYIFPPEAPAPDPSTLLKPRAKKVTPPAGETPAADPSAEPTVEPTEPTTEPTTDVATEPTVEPTTEPTEPTVEPPTDVATDPVIEPTVDPVPEPDLTDTTPTISDTPSEDIPDEPVFPDLDQPGNAVDEPNFSNTDSIDGDETAPSGEDNLTEQILLDLEKQAKGAKAPVQKTEYVNPPDYEYKGRGLVYNCTGKHWACVDAPSYKTCEENSSSVKYLKKKTECYPFNVYETTRGCEDIQRRMVSSSAKTNFCDD